MWINRGTDKGRSDQTNTSGTVSIQNLTCEYLNKTRYVSTEHTCPPRFGLYPNGKNIWMRKFHNYFPNAQSDLLYVQCDS